MRFDLAQSGHHSGHVVIINNLNFDLHETFSSVFIALNFRVQTLCDLSLEEIRSILNQCVEADLKDERCLVVIVLTHKVHGCKLRARDRTYNSNEILSPFLNCASLQGKPKIFFFMTLEERAITNKTASSVELTATSFQSIKLTKEPDFLLIQSSCHGLHGRDNLEGYVQLLCDQLMKWPGGQYDLLTLLTRVNTRVKDTCVDSRTNCTLAPYVASTLRHELIISSSNLNVPSESILELERLDLATARSPGLVLLFNQFEFDVTWLARRGGSHCDMVKYSQTFTNLNFNVRTFVDLTAEDISKNIKYYATSEDLSSYGCMMVIVMTHGEMGMLWAKDQSYDPSHIWQPLHRCESLDGKPKIFLFQFDQIVRSCDEIEQSIKLKTRCTKQNLELPNDMNMLFIFNTNIIEGAAPMTSSLSQSKFTDLMCTELACWRKQQIHLLSILTKINENITSQSSPNSPALTFVSSLNKIIVFSTPERPCAAMQRTRRICLPQSDDVRPYSLRARFDPEKVVLKLDQEDKIDDEAIKPQMFGLTENAKEIVKNEFKEIILKNNTEEFARKLNKYQHNVKFLAKYLLQLIYNHDREELLPELLYRDLPQEELLYFLWRTITDPDCSHEMLEKSCTSLSHLLQYHMDFTYRHSEESNNITNTSGFPLLCVLKSTEDENREHLKN